MVIMVVSAMNYPSLTNDLSSTKRTLLVSLICNCFLMQGSASRVTASEPAVQGDLVVSVLTVENLSPSDSGVYTCSYRPIGETDYKFPMSPDDIYVYR